MDEVDPFFIFWLNGQMSGSCGPFTTLYHKLALRGKWLLVNDCNKAGPQLISGCISQKHGGCVRVLIDCHGMLPQQAATFAFPR